MAQRHRLAHEYGEINDPLIWTVATVHVPVMIGQIEPLKVPRTLPRTLALTLAFRAEEVMHENNHIPYLFSNATPHGTFLQKLTKVTRMSKMLCAEMPHFSGF